MTPGAVAGSGAHGPGAGDRRRVLMTLCFTQITGWGVLYYAFPVLQESIAADTGWPTTWVAGAFALGQVTAAVAGVAVGRVLDRRGPWLAMTLGSAAAVAALVVIATAHTLWWFTAGWLLAGLAMAGVLYGPAFAAVTGWFDGRDRVRALTVLTVAGGLASTVFGPLTASLHAYLSWRTTYLVLAGVLATTALAHGRGLRVPWPVRVDAPLARQAADVRVIVRSRAFVALALAFTITALCSTAVVVSLVPMVREQGVSLGTAGLLLGLGGIGQVAGRLGFAPFAARIGTVGQTVSVLAVLTVTTALLAGAAAVPVLAAVVLVAGAARGSLTLLRAVAVTDRWGARHYGRLSGLLALPVALSAASAPWVAARLAASLGGYAPAFVALAALNLVAVALAFLTRPPGERSDGRPAAAGAPYRRVST